MSKIGKRPISIPAGVEVTQHDGTLEFKGKEGSIRLPLLPFLDIAIQPAGDKGSELIVSIKNQETDPQANANWGTMAALAKNAINGVNQGFSKVLEIEGIGFKASMEGTALVLSVGFTHPVKFVPPAGVKISVEKNIMRISGADKAAVGEVAANIRKIKKPEPYKGKGIHYQGEVIRRKAGKKIAGAGTAAA